MARTALITGVAGQDGVLLARLLVSRGYHVVGTVQPGMPSPLRTYLTGVTIEDHDLRDTPGFEHLLATYEPDEVYNLAGFTSVVASWDHRELVTEVNAVAVEDMLDSLVSLRDRGSAAPRFFQASSSEVFGPCVTNPQDESTPLNPQNPYAESKSRAHEATMRARDQWGLFACVGVLYNHESPLRPAQFVTRKITRAAAEIALGRRDSITLGNLEVSRDWGAARDYVIAMHASMGHDVPDDYVIATGRLHSLSELIEIAFARAGVADPWSYVKQDTDLLRRSEPAGLCGDPRRTRERLGWSASTPFEQLIGEMVDVDLRRIGSGVQESPGYLDVVRS